MKLTFCLNLDTPDSEVKCTKGRLRIILLSLKVISSYSKTKPTIVKHTRHIWGLVANMLGSNHRRTQERKLSQARPWATFFK